MAPSTYLEQIVAAHRARAAADRRLVEDLIEKASLSRDVRPFRSALRGGTLSVIAEIKRRSPSKGDIDAGLDPARLARSYAEGGAACLSVLTDAEFFAGSPADLRAARSASSVPVLRKDFTVCEADVCDARIMGADALLLIAGVLDDAELSRLMALSSILGMSSLVEVHDEIELERVLLLGADLVGVNQRDLVTFGVDPTRAERLAALIPSDVVAVAESGISGPDEARALAACGYDAVLVGESLVRSSDPASAVASMSGAAVERLRRQAVSRLG